MELTTMQIKKLKAIEQRMVNANKEILAMGFNCYLANDTVNIMCGPSHDNSNSTNALRENSIWAFSLKGWSGGDW